jgi:hypothetical protein
MMRFAALPPCSVLLLVWALAAPVSAADPESPMHCSSYTVGADTHTECSPSPSGPPGTTIRCRNYTVGTDIHAECSRVPSTRLALPGGKIPSPPPATSPRCYTYQIGSSSYTECR